MFTSIKKDLSLSIAYVILVLLCFYPYVFNVVFHLGSESLLLIVFFGITILGVLKGKGCLPSNLIVCLVIQIVGWVIYAGLHNDTSYITRVFFIIMSSLLLLYLIKRKELFRFTYAYNQFIALQALLGVPVFFLVALGLLSPIAEFQNIDGRPFYFYGITFSNAITAGISRICGFFDEPGALAFWGIFALIFNKLTSNNIKTEVILIISLLFTLSAAYFVQLFLYLLFFYSTKAKTFIPILFILGIITIATFKFIGDNEQLMYLTIERFEGGTIRSGRTEMTAEAKQVFKESPIIGIGAENLNERGYFDDNPYEIPAKDGILGVLITYLPLMVVLFKYGLRDKKVLFAVLILLAGYLQRPFHVNLLHSMMLYLFVLLVYYKNKNYEV